MKYVMGTVSTVGYVEEGPRGKGTGAAHLEPDTSGDRAACSGVSQG